MSTYIPSAYGEAMKETSKNILQMMMQRRQEALEQQRIEISKQQLGLAERQISATERGDALSRIVQMSAFAPADKPVAQMPWMHEDIQALWPGSDPTSLQDAGGLTLHEGTMNDIVLAKAKEVLADPELSPAQAKQLSELIGIKGLTGEATTMQGMELANTVVKIKMDSLRGLALDPKFLERVRRNVLGFPDLTTVTFGGKTQTFESPQEAQLAVDIFKHREMLNFYESRMDKQQIQDVTGELKDDFNKYSQVGQLGRASAAKIVTLAYGEGGGPQKLVDAINGVEGAPKLSDIEKIAAVFFVNGARLVDDGIPQWLEQLGPAGMQAQMMLRGATFLGGDPKSPDPDRRGLGLPATEVANALPGLMKFFGEVGVPGAPSVRPMLMPNWGSTWAGITLRPAGVTGPEGMNRQEAAHKAAQDFADGKRDSPSITREFGTELGNRILLWGTQLKKSNGTGGKK